MRIFLTLRRGAAAVWLVLAAAIISPSFASAQNAAVPTPRAKQAAHKSKAAAKTQQAEHKEPEENDGTGFACTAISNIKKIDISAFGVQINNVRARAVPGIADSFNLFEVSYKVSNANAQKIWVSGEFIFGFDGKLAGAVSANSGLTGILPHESALLKGTVISKDIFFKTENLCYRFSVEQQK